MGTSLFRGARPGIGRLQGQADYRVLIATLQALQLATATAKAGARAAQAVADAAHGDPLVEILSGEAGWQDAVNAQQGCFNRHFASGTPKSEG